MALAGPWPPAPKQKLLTTSQLTISKAFIEIDYHGTSMARLAISPLDLEIGDLPARTIDF